MIERDLATFNKVSQSFSRRGWSTAHSLTYYMKQCSVAQHHINSFNALNVLFKMITLFTAVYNYVHLL